MRSRSTSALACCALLLAAVGAGACGSATSGRQTQSRRTASLASVEPEIGAAAVRVGRHSLTPAMVEHWTRVEGALTYRHSAAAKQTPPPGAIPDPPTYANCIAYLAARARARAVGAPASPATHAALRAECEREQQALRLHVLEILLTDFWVQEELRAHGIAVTASEVQHAVDEEFASGRQFAWYLAVTGERASDARFIIAGHLGTTKLQKRVSPLRSHTGHETAQMAEQVDLAYQRLGGAIKRTWIPRTSCRAGYVVVECREYRGPADTGNGPGGL